MRVIICGAGRVGFGIAKHLAAENVEVTVIDQSMELIRSLSEQIDVRGIVGHGAHPDVLDQAGANTADMLIAVTFSDEVNMTACQVGHSLFSIPTKVARVRSQAYLDPAWQTLFSRENMPIDVVISPEREVARSVLRRLEMPGAFDTVDFAEESVSFLGVRISEGAALLNTPLHQITELFPNLKARIVGIWRGGHMIVPQRDDQLAEGDEVYVMSDRTHVGRTLDLLGYDQKEARRVLLLGGGNIGLSVAQSLERGQSRVYAKIIESRKDRAEAVASELDRTMVLHGSALDHDVLREAGIADAETVVALTNEDQVNILACVIAKNEGAKRTLALINNDTYGDIVQSLGIDAFIDPRATTVSTILQHMRRGRIKRLHTVRGGAAEAIEAEALETSPLVNTPLKDANIPAGIIIGIVKRGKEIVVARGDTVILPHDRVVLFVLREAVPQVQRLFRVSIQYF